MITLLVEVAVVVIAFALLYWLIGQIPLPEPVKKIVNVVLVVIAVIFIIVLLLQLPGVVGTLRLPR